VSNRKTKIGVTMPVFNTPYKAIADMAVAAENAGFDAAWDYEFYRNPFSIHCINALRTNRITLATGLATAAPRTPFAMANAAADVDELSGGRALIGMSTGTAGYSELLSGTEIDHPATRMREYITCMRMSWDYLRTGEAPGFQGKYYKFTPPPFNPWGLRKELVRPRIPIYLAGLKPAMMRTAGEIADGTLGYIVTPKYAKELWLPPIEEGLRKAGRSRSDFQAASLVICSVSENREEAMRLARINVGLYTSHPVGTFIVDFMGLGADRDRVVQAMMTEGPASFERTVSDALVKAFAVAGTPDECREQMKQYEEVLDHIVLHTPYVKPITDEESQAAYYRIVKFLGANARS
jgi:probable F420-dependent oxidoreductase